MPTPPNINQDLYDEIIKGSLDTLRLTANQQSEIADELQVLKKQLGGELSTGEVLEGNQAEVETVIKKITDLINTKFSEISDSSDDTADAIREASYNRTDLAMKAIFHEAEEDAGEAVAEEGVGQIVDTLVQGLPLSEWWSEQAGDLVFKVIQNIRQGIANGETMGQIVTRIVGNKTTTGVVDIAKNYAQTLTHTSIQAAQANGRKKAFQDNNNVVNGIMQVSTLDSHTSEICIAYSGATWDLNYEPTGDNDLPYNGGVPRHFNCRSVEVPITKSFADLGIDAPEETLTTRASADGQISAKTTFNDFLKRMGNDFQDETLGQGRADLWRDGKITLRDLVSGTGSPLTLDQLRAKAGISTEEDS